MPVRDRLASLKVRLMTGSSQYEADTTDSLQKTVVKDGDVMVMSSLINTTIEEENTDEVSILSFLLRFRRRSYPFFDVPHLILFFVLPRSSHSVFFCVTSSHSSL